jgi:hypothetical protein
MAFISFIYSHASHAGFDSQFLHGNSAGLSFSKAWDNLMYFAAFFYNL